MQYAMTDAIFIFHFRLFFALNGPKNQNFWKMKKTWRHHHVHTKNYDHMM